MSDKKIKEITTKCYIKLGFLKSQSMFFLSRVDFGRFCHRRGCGSSWIYILFSESGSGRQIDNRSGSVESEKGS